MVFLLIVVIAVRQTLLICHQLLECDGDRQLRRLVLAMDGQRGVRDCQPQQRYRFQGKWPLRGFLWVQGVLFCFGRGRVIRNGRP